MDKYYEMFRDKNQGNKEEFFNPPDIPQNWDQNSDVDTWTVDLGEVRVWVTNSELWEREKPVLLRLHLDWKVLSW